MMTSLGNIEATALASLTFPSFTNGSLLYLTGIAHNLVGAPAQAIMPSQNALTTIQVTGYTFIEDALPVRQREGTRPQMSPYTPPVKLLIEEQTSSTYFSNEDNVHVKLSCIELHSSDLATFTFESPHKIDIIPGQAAILDFTSLFGASSYRHMAPENPTSVNDDRIRTWTASRCSSWAPVEDGGSMTFSLTMRLKPGGAITEALFGIVRKLAELRPEFLADSRPLGLSARLVGIVGDFTLEPQDPIECAKVAITSVHSNAPKRLLWIAGGIGITPFLAMLSGISSCSTEYEITLLLSTREPDILLSLLSNAIKAAPHGIKLIVHVFSRTEVFESPLPPSVLLHHHSGRITSSILSDFKGECQDGVYVCGPESFEQVIMQGVVGKVKREGFAY
jgi:NAD(P)H-flavin reductase